MWDHNNDRRASFNSVNFFYPLPVKPEAEIWQLRKEHQDEAEAVGGDSQTPVKVVGGDSQTPARERFPQHFGRVPRGVGIYVFYTVETILKKPTKTWMINRESIELKERASMDDLSSLASWAPTILTRSSVGSTGSLDSCAPSALSSVNTTPGGSPVSTPTTTRRKLKPALKLNLDNVTWTNTRDRRRRRARLRHNIQAGSAKVRAVMKQSKTPQFRTRIVLLTLFALIVTIVSFTWHMYQRQLLQLAIGDKIRFHEARRVLHLLREDGRELVEAALGNGIPGDLGPHHCDKHNPLSPSHMCEEWKFRARLHISFSHGSNLSCYHVNWESLSPTTVLRDCIALKNAKWYGMGLQRRLQWPLQPTPGESAQAFVTGDGVEEMFGGILDRYWLSSDGVAVLVQPDVPLYIKITKSYLCLESRGDEEFPYQRFRSTMLNYTICTGEDMRTLHQDMMLNYRAPLTDSSGRYFLRRPIWVVPSSQELTQASVQEFANQIMEHTTRLAGFFLLDGRWEQQEGSLEFNRKKFPNPREILKILENKGFRVLLVIHPYVCLPSRAFAAAVKGRHLVTDRWRLVPLLNRWRGKVCGVIDFTNNTTATWFLNRLIRLKQNYDIHGFVFTGGQSTYLPRSYAFQLPSINPDVFLSKYLSVAEKVGTMFGTDVGFLTQKFPAFVRLTPRTVSWDNHSGLASVIPEVLTLGVLGYPLVDPGSVGGDSTGEIPSKELYLRWMQLAVFLPVVQFTVAPGHYDQEVVDTVYRLFAIRERFVLPVFAGSLDEFRETAAPLIRPLWWITPKDHHAQISNSQFMVGERLMVAPVLAEGRRSRDIYLPPGWWKDHLLGGVRRGGKWLHNYPVALSKVAYFSVADEPL